MGRSASLVGSRWWLGWETIKKMKHSAVRLGLVKVHETFASVQSFRKSHRNKLPGNHKLHRTARCSLHRRLKLCQRHPVMCRPLNSWLQPASQLIFAPVPVDPSLYNEIKSIMPDRIEPRLHATSKWQVPTESCDMKQPNGATSYCRSAIVEQTQKTWQSQEQLVTPVAHGPDNRKHDGAETMR